MERLIDLPNIGLTLERKLINANINASEELKQLGSKEAFFRIKLSDSDCCYSMLCALEGAIQGIRWYHISDEKKRELKEFYERVEKEDKK